MPVRLYYKAGISFSKLKPKEYKQFGIFVEDSTPQEKPEVEHQKWQTRREMLSKEFTTNWEDLPLAY
jgi:hypothetical protein